MRKSRSEYVAALGETFKYCMQCGESLKPATVDDELRLACSARGCDFVHWNNPVPVVAVLVEQVSGCEQSGEFILAHNVLWPEGTYSVITGFMEAEDESPALAARREVKEELNLDALCYHYIGHYSSARANQLILAFHVKASGDLRLNAELDDYKRLGFEQLKGWNSETGRAVGDFINQRRANLLSCTYYKSQ